MADEIMKSGGESVFDSIKHTDEDGNEYWFAR